MPKGAVDATIKIHGLREYQRGMKKAELDAQKEVRDGLAKAAEPVREEWRRLLTPYHEKSASKLKTRVGVSGVFVRQSARKTTGEHPEFAALQMRLGEAALDVKANEAERILEREVEDLCDTAEGKV
jgi:hypothetical protein